MHDVFNGYRTSDMVVHEWAHEILHIGFENLSFQIVGISIMMHYWCLETSIYVLITHVILQHTINQMQIRCFEVITKLNDELEKLFLVHDVMDALGVIYLQYWIPIVTIVLDANILDL
jgi:hypothetical protein